MVEYELPGALRPYVRFNQDTNTFSFKGLKKNSQLAGSNHLVRINLLDSGFSDPISYTQMIEILSSEEPTTTFEVPEET